MLDHEMATLLGAYNSVFDKHIAIARPWLRKFAAEFRARMEPAAGPADFETFRAAAVEFMTRLGDPEATRVFAKP